MALCGFALRVGGEAAKPEVDVVRPVAFAEGAFGEFPVVAVDLSTETWNRVSERTDADESFDTVVNRLLDEAAD